MRPASTGKRAKIVAEIERAIVRLDNRPGLCLYYAHHTAAVLWRHGRPAVVQASSLQWPRVCREEDDGVIDAHFAYEWTPQSIESRASAAIGNLPEMHVQVGLLDSQEVADFTTRHLKAAASERGMTWTAADPPAYLWCPTGNLPD